MSLSIELVTTPVVCMICHKKIGEFASPDVGPAGESSGVCDPCKPELKRIMGVA